MEILIIDDHLVVREGLRRRLGSRSVARDTTASKASSSNFQSFAGSLTTAAVGANQHEHHNGMQGEAEMGNRMLLKMLSVPGDQPSLRRSPRRHATDLAGGICRDPALAPTCPAHSVTAAKGATSAG
jgi:hypothetical protein